MRGIKKAIGVLVLVAAYLLMTLPMAVASRPKDTLVVGLIAEPKSLDSAVSVMATDFRVANSLFEGLVKYQDGSLKPKPGLATHWEVSDDGLIYTFWLRKDVKFHDGTDFNAAAVKFSFDRVFDKNHPYHFTGPFPLSSFLGPVKSTKIIDQYTIELHLKTPHASFMDILPFPIATIVSPTAVKKWGKKFSHHPVGTGPFQFSKWKQRRYIMFERNPNYWGQKAKLKTLIFRPFADDNVRLSEMFAGGLDMMIELPPDSLAHFKQDPRFKILNELSTSRSYFILNMKEAPFNDKRMRQAVNYAINREAIRDNILKGMASISRGPTPPAMEWAHNKEIKPYAYNPEKARQLIKEAGFENYEINMHVFEASATLPSNLSVVTAIQADLAAVGLKVKLEVFELNTYYQHIFTKGMEGKAHIAQWGWNAIEPNYVAQQSLSSNKLFNPGYYSNSRVDALVIKAQRTRDQQLRAKYYKEMQEIVNEEAPWIFFMNLRQFVATTKEVHGFKLHPSLISFFAETYKE